MGKPKIHMEDFSDMLNFEPEAVPSQNQEDVPAQSGILEMNFEQMEPFPNHKFKLYEGQQLADMVESIRQFGILLPLILWHTGEGKYIILSGHNRCHAAKLVGIDKGPVIVKENLSYEDAVLIVTETNLRQRSFTDMSHSERAFCLAQHYKALKAQGRRSDLLEEIEVLLNPHEIKENTTTVQVEQRLESREKLGQEYGLSASKVGRYVRIASLIEPLLCRVDTGEISFLAAYDLSFIEDLEKQKRIVNLIESENYKLDMKKAELLRSYYETGKLSDTAIAEILSGEKRQRRKTSKPQPFKVKPTVITKYFTEGQSAKEIEDTIERALALYFEMQEQNFK